MNHIPNLLSLSRIPLSGLLFWLIVQDLWRPAAIVFAVALLTDAIDGWLARKYGWTSKLGGEVLEPVCDLILSIAALGALAFAGVWSWWLIVVIAVVTVAFQLISNYADRGQIMRRLKRHQHYLHPMFFVAVVLAAFLTVLRQTDPPFLVALLIVVVIMIILASKRDRIKDLLNGP